MDAKTISDIINGKTSDMTLIEEATRQYPFFVAAALKALENASTPAQRQQLKMRIACNVGDSNTLADILGEAPEEFINFYPDESKPHLSTDDTIESFLDKFGDSTEKQAAAELPPVGAPAVEYLDESQFEDSPLPEGEGEEEDSTASMLDSFLAAHPAPTMRARAGKPEQAAPSVSAEEKPNAENIARKEDEEKLPPKSASASENGNLTESFARIMIKNHNYSKALEIIETLNLNNPEKSIYFADQIRFLKKLIAHESKKRNIE